MIKLKYHDPLYCEIVLDRSDNYLIKRAKNLPVIEYQQKGKKWLLPIRDLRLFNTHLKKYKQSLVVSSRVAEQFKNSLKLEFQLLQLKEFGAFKQVQFDNYNDLLKIPLRRFQTVGAEFLYCAEQAALCDDVGAGKTSQAIAAMERNFSDGHVNFCLVVTPSSLCNNWYYELDKFVDSPDVLTINRINDFEHNKTMATKARRRLIYNRANRYKYLIISYDILVRDFVDIEQMIFNRGAFKIGFIFDEIQNIRNSGTQRAVYAKKAARHGIVRYGLSATMIENTLFDLWSCYHVLRTDLFGGVRTKERFANRYIDVDFFGRIDSYKNQRFLKKRFEPYFLRRVKEDVIDELPKRNEVQVWLDFNPEHKKIYNDICNKAVEEVLSQEKKRKIKMAQILAMISYMRQCALSTKLIGHKKEYSTKLDALLELIVDTNCNEKFVVFCYFTGMLDIIQDELKAAKISCMSIHGKNTNASERVELVRKFNDNNTRVLLASDVLREGFNIPAANHVVNFDLLYNPQRMQQRAGRIDRIGQKNKVINIWTLIVESSIECDIWEIASGKKQLASNTLDNGRIEGRLTFKDVKNLLHIKQ